MSAQERNFHPCDAAYAVAQFLPVDPALWIEQCALAGITLVPLPGGGFCMVLRNGEVRADSQQYTFLSSWLNLTPGAEEAVAELLHRRSA